MADNIKIFFIVFKLCRNSSNKSTVPVELVSFTAKVNESKIILSWRTATEANNYGLEVERKISGINNWEDIGL